MSQNFVENCYERTRKPANVDMKYFEKNFEDLKTEFSGASAPPNSVAFQNWGDTAQKVKRFRSYNNSEWYGYWHGDSDQKIWMYKDDTIDGWAIDSTPSDVVISIKGGDTYTAGGETGSAYGDWDGVSGLAHSHKAFGAYYVVYQTYSVGYMVFFDSNGNWVNDTGREWSTLTPSVWGEMLYSWGPSTVAMAAPTSANNELWDGSGTKKARFSYTDDGNTTWPSTWRPKAAVGTIQYLEI